MHIKGHHAPPAQLPLPRAAKNGSPAERPQEVSEAALNVFDILLSNESRAAP